MAEDTFSSEVPQYEFPYPNKFLINSLTKSRDTRLVFEAQAGKDIGDTSPNKEEGRDLIYKKAIEVLHGNPGRTDLVQALFANFTHWQELAEIRREKEVALANATTEEEKSSASKDLLKGLTNAQTLRVEKGRAREYDSLMTGLRKMA